MLLEVIIQITVTITELEKMDLPAWHQTQARSFISINPLSCYITQSLLNQIPFHKFCINCLNICQNLCVKFLQCCYSITYNNNNMHQLLTPAWNILLNI